MHACMHTYVHKASHAYMESCVCMHVCVYVCMYIYIYIYIHTHIHTYMLYMHTYMHFVSHIGGYPLPQAAAAAPSFAAYGIYWQEWEGAWIGLLERMWSWDASSTLCWYPRHIAFTHAHTTHTNETCILFRRHVHMDIHTYRHVHFSSW